MRARRYSHICTGTGWGLECCGSHVWYRSRVAAIRPSNCESRFLWWWLHSQLGSLASVATGSTYAAVTADDLGSLQFPLIRVEEQRRIADFLDVETARIDGLVTLRRRMRGLLGLKRERVIERALGLEGQFVTDKIVPLAYLCREVVVGIVITPAVWYVEGGGVPALRGLNIRPGRVDKTEMVMISHEGHAIHRKSALAAGDIVVVRTGMAGAAAVVPPELNGANCIDLVIVRPRSDLHPRFIEYVLNSPYARRRVDEYSVGSIQAHFNVGAMKKMPIPYIPASDQWRIVEWLDRETGKFDELMTRIDSQEKLLEERRRALITAAVTGQFDVTAARA
ncbi:MAG TPA: restriction endonuclease subunit S [Pseudonocardiaceae bacterium]|nr:restriction endonuclease subunit S [Pseudonocardiaceae bacterium]